MGCFESEYKIHLKANAKPIAHAPRRVPHAIKDRLRKKLDELCANGIIEKANGYNEWVNHLVTVEKKDAERNLRLCIDPQQLNLCISDEHTYIPSFEDVASRVRNMKYFTVVDLKDGFWQVKLDKGSSRLCTFATPFGSFRWLRMPFGVKTAPSAFQKMNFENFGDIENVIIYIDDILIMGRNRKEHDETLIKVLQRAREKNVKFNPKKLQFALERVKYLGHVFSLNEIKPDPNRLLAIKEMGKPKSKKDLQTFLGVVNFMRPFIQNLSELTAPLRELLRKNVVFDWTELHTKVVDDVKQQILNSKILVPFDPSKELIVQCDASQFGLGCCLIQDGKPISFASRSLTSGEQNYAQIEKEMLSILFACNKFNFYTYGRPIKVVNDHKPLLGIMKKEIHKISSAKLQRLKLKLLNYDISLQYAPGKTIQLADYLSRYMIKSDENDEDKSLTESILSINVSDERKLELQRETEQDEVLRKIKEFCRIGWPKNKTDCPVALKHYFKLRNEIFLDDDLLFFHERIIIPSSMRRFILNKLHEPHFGVNKTQRRARDSVFWPCINNEIEQLVSQCAVCQENSAMNVKEPMISHEIPNAPFEKVACDILEHKGKNYLALMDFYSKWIELIKLSSKTSSEVNKHLLRIFTTFGYPHIIIADNMPFGSFECNQFANKHDFKIRTTSPNYAQSNGLAEKSVDICKRILRKSSNEEETLHALLAYRTTPTKDMTYAPCELLQNRVLRTDMPMHINKFKPKLCVGVEDQLKNKQNKSEAHYNKTAKQRNTEFAPNQQVLFLNNNKWQHGQIVKQHDTPRSFIIDSDGREFRRNTRHIKIFNGSTAAATALPDQHQKVTRSGKSY